MESWLKILLTIIAVDYKKMKTEDLGVALIIKENIADIKLF
jgi:hypothetical protein